MGWGRCAISSVGGSRTLCSSRGFTVMINTRSLAGTRLYIRRGGLAPVRPILRRPVVAGHDIPPATRKLEHLAITKEGSVRVNVNCNRGMPPFLFQYFISKLFKLIFVVCQPVTSIV